MDYHLAATAQDGWAPQRSLHRSLIRNLKPRSWAAPAAAAALLGLCLMGTPSVMAQPQVLTTLIAQNSQREAHTEHRWTDTGRYVRAADGDTLTVQTDRHGLVTVRLAGVDAPERDMRYAEEATRFLKAFVQSASLSLDCHSMDRYGRHVCEVRKGQQDLGAELIAAGLAWHFKRYASEQSSTHRDLYAKLETAARTKRLGLWADAQAMDPQACRKLKREGHACP